MINELQAQLKSRNNRIRKWQKDLSNLREDRNKLRRDLDDKGESCFLSAVTHMCLTSWLHDILNFCFCQKRELIRQWKILKWWKILLKKKKKTSDERKGRNVTFWRVSSFSACFFFFFFFFFLTFSWNCKMLTVLSMWNVPYCRELGEASEIIQSVSAHEAEARQKLEGFIMAALDRAQKAEDEAHNLRAQLFLSPMLRSRATTPRQVPQMNSWNCVQLHFCDSQNVHFLFVIFSLQSPVVSGTKWVRTQNSWSISSFFFVWDSVYAFHCLRVFLQVQFSNFSSCFQHTNTEIGCVRQHRAK